MSAVVAVANLWRRYWPVDALAVIFLVVVFIFGSYLTHRATLADARNERQRAAICAILANLPGHVPPYLATGRRQFARPGHPNDCQPIPTKAHRAAAATSSSVSPQPRQTVVIVLTPARSASPAATRTATPRPAPTPTPTRTPRPTPSPSRTPCLLPGVPPGCG